MTSRLLIAASVLALTACGGGGGGGIAGPPGAPAQPVVPVTAATAAPTSIPTTAPQSTAEVTLTIPSQQTTASHGRSPQFVSANAKLFQSTVVSVNGSTTLPNGTPAVLTTQLTPTASNSGCSVGFNPPLTQCVVTIQAPTGTVVYQFDLFDKAGLRLSSANPTFAMPGTGLQAQMKGIVTFVGIESPIDLTYGTSYDGQVSVLAYDASGSWIGGSVPYFQPFTVCDSDTSGHTTLVDATDRNHPVAKLCVSITDPDTGAYVNLRYDGSSMPPFTLTAAGGTLPPGGIVTTVYPEPRIVLAGTVAGSLHQSTLTFTARPQTKSFTASQPGHSGPFGFSLDPTTCGSGASAKVTVATADHITFDVTALNSGTCYGTVRGLGTSTEIVYFQVP
jgi:hypothetical protein